jgi:capsular polysaccharide biosynthesis protein
MTQEQFTTQLKNSKAGIVAMTLLVTSVVFAVAAMLPAKYQSDASLIVIQKQSSDKVDAFSATKSAEYLSNILTRVIYTNDFFKDVMESPYEIQNTFPHDPEELKIAWEKQIDTRKVNNTGIIKITVYDTNREQAEAIAQGISWNLSENGQKYHGGGEMVEVKLIDGPITSSRQTQPNVLGLTLIGSIVGFIGSLSTVYFFPYVLVRKKRQTAAQIEGEYTELDKKEDIVYNDLSSGKILSQQRLAETEQEASQNEVESKIRTLMNEQV